MKHNIDGQQAEIAVARYLEARAYEIIDRNWKVPNCEIDIVVKRQSCIYFVEVKYRSSDDQGEGFDYITPAKLRQMAFAAEMWVAKHSWEGEYCLSAASVAGNNFAVSFIEEI